MTSVFAKIYQPEVLESAFSVVSKLNCSSGIERSDTCIDLNEPEVDCTNGRTRSVKKKKKRKRKVNVVFLVSRGSVNQFTAIENSQWYYLVKARGYNWQGAVGRSFHWRLNSARQHHLTDCDRLQQQRVIRWKEKEVSLRRGTHSLLTAMWDHTLTTSPRQ